MDEFIYLGSIVNKKGGTDEDIQARICDAWTNMEIHSANNQDKTESLWVKREGSALVWF